MSLPPVEIPLGAMRFNSDSQKLEYWNGQIWMQVHTFSPNLDGGARGIFGGGNNPTTNTIEYITISSAGNGTDFGDLAGDARWGPKGLASRTRGILAGGYLNNPNTFYNTIEYITISSTGNSADFGDLVTGVYNPASLSSATRGIVAGGANLSPTPFAESNEITYITIASTGNSVDFGNLTVVRETPGGNVASPTRGIIAGGDSPSEVNSIDYITIATTGNANDFGDLTLARIEPAGFSNTTRGLFACGGDPYTDRIDYITIATTGNAIDFGNATNSPRALGGLASSTRGIVAGGTPDASTLLNTIQYVSIATQGDAVDFGDLITARRDFASLSNDHGGLG